MNIDFKALEIFSDENAKCHKALLCNKRYLCVPQNEWSEEVIECNVKQRTNRQLDVVIGDVQNPMLSSTGLLQLSCDKDIGMQSLQLVFTDCTQQAKAVRSISVVECKIVG